MSLRLPICCWSKGQLRHEHRSGQRKWYLETKACFLITLDVKMMVSSALNCSTILDCHERAAGSPSLPAPVSSAGAGAAGTGLRLLFLLRTIALTDDDREEKTRLFDSAQRLMIFATLLLINAVIACPHRCVLLLHARQERKREERGEREEEREPESAPSFLFSLSGFQVFPCERCNIEPQSH